jgi:hypothetical protein
MFKMLLISVDGWVNGITGTFSFLLGTILGISIIYQTRKIEARLLLIMGINILITGFFWFEIFCDFISVILTTNNLPNPNGWLGVFYLMWSPIAFLISLYIFGELFYPEKKKYFMIPFLILGIIYELYIFIAPLSSFTFDYPSVSGERLIGIEFTSFTLPFIINYLLVLVGLIVFGFGYLIKGLRSKGVIKKKLLLLSVGYFLFIAFPLFALFVSGYIVYLVRIGMVSSFFFFYFGLKEAPIKKEKKQMKKEIKVEDSLFRLYERPVQISEEEVTFHRDRKICLSCKRDVSRLSYICPKCNALYCTNCSETLSDLENMCWVCNEPFDESKPTRPHKIVYKDLDGDEKKKKTSND